MVAEHLQGPGPGDHHGADPRAAGAAPGHRAMVQSMKPGSVVVDIAVESGGNVEGSQVGKVVDLKRVKVVGHANLPARLAPATSALYARNLLNFVESADRPGEQEAEDRRRRRSDQRHADHQGRPGRAPGLAAQPSRLTPLWRSRHWGTAGMPAIDPTVFNLIIFVLAIFVGYYVVWSVTPALHTPLMSVTNAISSVIIVGALIATGAGGLKLPP